MDIRKRSFEPTGALDGLVEDELIRDILLSRGVRDRKDLECGLRDLEHYESLKGIDKGAELLAEAVAGGRKIGIAGDYDVDGMSGTALGVLALTEMGAGQVAFHVPSRYDGGYGLGGQGIEHFKTCGTELIVTVDNGISSHEAIAQARELGMQVIVTDHHDCPETLPEADAVINPKQPGCAFPSKSLAGVGVLFYLLLAVRQKLTDMGHFASDPPNMGSYLDLVALGTIGDVVQLDTNNRRIVKGALRRIRSGQMQTGIRALMEVSGCDFSEASANTFAFTLGPRLNAATRIRLERNFALECLMERDHGRALELARQLEYCNRRRADHEQVMYEDAMEILGEGDPGSAVVVYKETFLLGIVGLLAGRLRAQYGRPCFVFAPSGDGVNAVGSGRSAGGLPLSEVLSEIGAEHPGLIVKSGGHAQAAGATVDLSRLGEFAQAFRDKAASRPSGGGGEVIYTDGELPYDRLSCDFASRLLDYGPYGQGFEEPCFDGVFEVDQAYVVKEHHLRLKLRRPEGFMSAMLFRATPEQLRLQKGSTVKVVYTLGVGHYNGSRRLEVKVSHLEPA